MPTTRRRPTSRCVGRWSVSGCLPGARPRAPEAAGAAGPVRVYRQPGGRAPRRRIALGVVAATAALAFVIAVAALTAGDLISGGSIGKGGGRTTLLGGQRQEEGRRSAGAADHAHADDS